MSHHDPLKSSSPKILYRLGDRSIKASTGLPDHQRPLRCCPPRNPFVVADHGFGQRSAGA